MSVDVRQGDKEGLDRERRYLRPVADYDWAAETHLAVYRWLPMFEAWATGPGICGKSTPQGPLPEGVTVTCYRCVDRRPKYERYLAPGYEPADDDPELLRQRAETADRQVLQAQALVAKWRQVAAERPGATVLVGVAADVLHATLGGLNDLLAEMGERNSR
ncbi:hypothetical protein AB0G67_40295 [Streptomyces sp. NPDC021056]|uniref:hypothetical protein n=1 Tax=Streptomyces sp. NPDC021056 TaxID=3155012 RepID=UPI0033DF194A